MLRGLTSLFFGLMLGLVGIDLQTGQPRLTFGLPELLDGISVVLVAVALFAVGETLHLAWRYREGKAEVLPVGRIAMSRSDWRRSLGPWFRGAGLGFPFGVMPAGGSEMPTMLSYYTERKLASPRRRRNSAPLARSRAWRGRRRRTTPPPPGRWCPC